jgi:hypothetical protein
VITWGRPPTDVVPVYVTVIGGAEEVYRLCDLRPGREGAEVIPVPKGAQTMTIQWAPQPGRPVSPLWSLLFRRPPRAE